MSAAFETNTTISRANYSFAADDFTVVKLGKRSIERQIEEEIKTLYLTIKSEIIERDNIGFSNLIYEMPENFSINETMSVERAQVIIYAKLLMILESKGLTVGLRHTKNKTFLWIQWLPSINSEEEKNLREYLKQRTIVNIAAKR
jgi:cell division protein FtsI/penicillin-binding protein 2